MMMLRRQFVLKAEDRYIFVLSSANATVQQLFDYVGKFFMIFDPTPLPLAVFYYYQFTNLANFLPLPP